MKLYVLFAQRRESYNGEFAPEAVTSVTEFQAEEQPELMRGLLDEHRALLGEDVVAINWISMDVDAAAIRGRLLPVERPIKAVIAGVEITDDEIIDIRDAMVSASAVRALTVLESNILRDCDIALRVVRCKDDTAKEARDRLVRYRSEGATP